MSLINKLMAPVNTTLISILGVGQFIMGAWLVLPFNSLPAYHLNFPSEWLIGLILAIIGAATTRYSIKADLKRLQWSTTMAYLFWITGMIFMITVNVTGMGWIVGLIFAAYCFMINLNIRVNRRNSK